MGGARERGWGSGRGWQPMLLCSPPSRGKDAACSQQERGWGSPGSAWKYNRRGRRLWQGAEPKRKGAPSVLAAGGGSWRGRGDAPWCAAGSTRLLCGCPGAGGTAAAAVHGACICPERRNVCWLLRQPWAGLNGAARARAALSLGGSFSSSQPASSPGSSCPSLLTCSKRLPALTLGCQMPSLWQVRDAVCCWGPQALQWEGANASPCGSWPRAAPCLSAQQMLLEPPALLGGHLKPAVIRISLGWKESTWAKSCPPTESQGTACFFGGAKGYEERPCSWRMGTELGD